MPRGRERKEARYLESRIQELVDKGISRDIAEKKAIREKDMRGWTPSGQAIKSRIK